MIELLNYLVKDDDAFFFLEFLFVNGKLTSKDIGADSRHIFDRFVSEALVYENFIKRGLYITKNYVISATGIEYYRIVQAIRENKKD